MLRLSVSRALPTSLAVATRAHPSIVSARHACLARHVASRPLLRTISLPETYVTVYGPVGTSLVRPFVILLTWTFWCPFSLFPSHLAYLYLNSLVGPRPWEEPNEWQSALSLFSPFACRRRRKSLDTPITNPRLCRWSRECPSRSRSRLSIPQAARTELPRVRIHSRKRNLPCTPLFPSLAPKTVSRQFFLRRLAPHRHTPRPLFSRSSHLSSLHELQFPQSRAPTRTERPFACFSGVICCIFLVIILLRRSFQHFTSLLPWYVHIAPFLFSFSDSHNENYR